LVTAAGNLRLLLVAGCVGAIAFLAARRARRFLTRVVRRGSGVHRTGRGRNGRVHATRKW
jgi:hypothetical protein